METYDVLVVGAPGPAGVAAANVRAACTAWGADDAAHKRRLWRHGGRRRPGPGPHARPRRPADGARPASSAGLWDRAWASPGSTTLATAQRAWREVVAAVGQPARRCVRRPRRPALVDPRASTVQLRFTVDAHTLQSRRPASGFAPIGSSSAQAGSAAACCRPRRGAQFGDPQRRLVRSTMRFRGLMLVIGAGATGRAGRLGVQRLPGTRGCSSFRPRPAHHPVTEDEDVSAAVAGGLRVPGVEVHRRPRASASIERFEAIADAACGCSLRARTAKSAEPRRRWLWAPSAGPPTPPALEPRPGLPVRRDRCRRGFMRRRRPAPAHDGGRTSGRPATSPAG